MRYVNKHGFKISAMTLGTVQLGLNYGIANKSGKPTPEKSHEILDAAIGGGINSIDTANSYGDSEEVIGSYFKKKETQNDILITTKFKIDPSLISTTSVEKQIYQFAEKSLLRLKINKIPVYMLHNAKDMSQYGSVVSNTMKKLIQDGLIEKAGVSVYNSEEVEEMLKHEVYEAVQLPMSIFDLRMQRNGIIKRLRGAEIIVFVRSVFLQGLFFLKPEELPAGFAPAAEALRQLKELSEEAGISVAQLALSCIRDMDGVTSLVLGAETPEQVSENIRLVDSPALTPELMSKIEHLSAGVPTEQIMNAILAKK